MASVFKRRDRNGKKRDVYEFKYRDAQGKWRYGVGWPDKEDTKNHALALEAECRAVRKGEKEAPAAWLEKRNTPIKTVITEYLAWGNTQGGRYGRAWDDFSASQKESYLNWWVETLGLSTLGDIDLYRVEKTVQDLLKTLAPKTANNKVEALRSLCLWSIRRGYLRANPLAGMARLDIRPKMPHRPLNAKEIAALLEHAPPHRRLWYETALATGFRLNELRSLNVRDFDAFAPSLFLAADNSKDRKPHRQPIPKDLAGKLRDLTEGKEADDPLLGIPKGGAAASDWISGDYDKAKVALETPEGRATWHSLRKCFVNALVRSGQDLKTVMTLARHSTAQLSMEVYASADPTLLRQGAQAAFEHIEKAISEAQCCADVARKAAQGGGEPVTINADNGLEVLELERVTGIEPV